MDSCSLFLFLLTFFGGYDLYIISTPWSWNEHQARRAAGASPTKNDIAERKVYENKVFNEKFFALATVSQSLGRGALQTEPPPSQLNTNLLPNTTLPCGSVYKLLASLQKVFSEHH